MFNKVAFNVSIDVQEVWCQERLAHAFGRQESFLPQGLVDRLFAAIWQMHWEDGESRQIGHQVARDAGGRQVYTSGKP